MRYTSLLNSKQKQNNRFVCRRIGLTRATYTPKVHWTEQSTLVIKDAAARKGMGASRVPNGLGIVPFEKPCNF